MFFRSANDASNLITRNLLAIGNNVQGGFNNSGLFACLLNAHTATRDIDNVYIIPCEIENFASASVVLFEHRGHVSSARKCVYTDRFKMCDVGKRINRDVSHKGNIHCAGLIGATSCLVEVNGHAGPIADVVVDDHIMDARYIKQGVIVYCDVDRVSVSVERITEAGFEAAGRDAGA